MFCLGFLGFASFFLVSFAFRVLLEESKLFYEGCAHRVSIFFT